MSRKSKYATYTKYKPYIKVIMDDLGITDKVDVDFIFSTWQRKGGDAKLYSWDQIEGKFQGRVRIDKRGTHAWIIEALMHELKHIEQYISGRLSWNVTWKQEVTKRGKVDNIPYRHWNGVLTRQYKLMPNKQGRANTEYLNNPWELEARDYEQESNRLRLFTKNQLPKAKTTKELVGVVGSVKFFKIAS